MKLKLIFLLTFPFFILENIVKSFSFQYIFDQGINHTDFSLEHMLKILFIIIIILMFTYLAGFIYKSVKICLIQKKLESIRESLLKCFLQDYRHTKKESSSSYLNIFSNDLKLLNDNYYEALFTLIENIFIFIISCFSVFVISPIMLFWILVTFAPVFIIPKILSKGLNKKTTTYSKENSEMLKKVNEYIGGIDVINQYKIIPSILQKSKIVFHNMYKAIINLKILQNGSDYLIGIFTNIIFVFVMVLGIYLYSKGMFWNLCL